jgi:hypothetical protein
VATGTKVKRYIDPSTIGKPHRTTYFSATRTAGNRGAGRGGAESDFTSVTKPLEEAAGVIVAGDSR